MIFAGIAFQADGFFGRRNPSLRDRLALRLIVQLHGYFGGVGLRQRQPVLRAGIFGLLRGDSPGIIHELLERRPILPVTCLLQIRHGNTRPRRRGQHQKNPHSSSIVVGRRRCYRRTPIFSSGQYTKTAFP